MSDAQHGNDDHGNLPPQADESALQESQAAIDDAKHAASETLDGSGVSEDVAEEGVPVPSEADPSGDPAPAP